MIFSTYSRGFSLTELIVSVAIMTMIMTVIVSNQSDYTSATALKNAANDLSLSLREAQIYGISVRKDTSASDFSSGYGIDFDTADDTSYTFFADKSPSNARYEPASEFLEKISLPPGDKVNKLCVIKTDLSEACRASAILDISFVRPAIEAKIYSSFYGGSIKGARIELSNADGSLKNSIVIYTTGQISVQ